MSRSPTRSSARAPSTCSTCRVGLPTSMCSGRAGTWPGSFVASPATLGSSSPTGVGGVARIGSRLRTSLLSRRSPKISSSLWMPQGLNGRRSSRRWRARSLRASSRRPTRIVSRPSSCTSPSWPTRRPMTCHGCPTLSAGRRTNESWSGMRGSSAPLTPVRSSRSSTATRRPTSGASSRRSRRRRSSSRMPTRRARSSVPITADTSQRASPVPDWWSTGTKTAPGGIDRGQTRSSTKSTGSWPY